MEARLVRGGLLLQRAGTTFRRIQTRSGHQDRDPDPAPRQMVQGQGAGLHGQQDARRRHRPLRHFGHGRGRNRSRARGQARRGRRNPVHLVSHHQGGRRTRRSEMQNNRRGTNPVGSISYRNQGRGGTHNAGEFRSRPVPLRGGHILRRHASARRSAGGLRSGHKGLYRESSV